MKRCLLLPENLIKVEVTKETIRVTPEEIEEAYKLVDPSLIDVIKKSAGKYPQLS